MVICFLMNTPNAGRTLKTENWLCIKSLAILRHIMTCFSVIFIIIIIIIVIIITVVIIMNNIINLRSP